MFKKLFNKKDKKVAILGIDGVPCSLLKEFSEKGIMPNLASLLKNGTLLEMDASIPEVSSTSWTCFMTGVNPGRHNIYGFTGLKQNSYGFYFPNSGDIKSDTIWDILGNNNKKSIVINVPSTYPAKPLNGILTAGFVAVDLRKATYPESAYEYLKGMGYKMDVDSQKAATSLESLTEDIDLTFSKRTEALFHFFDNHDWDLFIGTITETDRLHHFLWNALGDTNHPQHNYSIDFYKGIDSLIGKFADRCGENIPFMIVSDHGFSAIKQEVYLNSWLKQKGYLKFKKEQPESLEDIHPESLAFALDPSRIYINLKNRYPSGTVSESNYEDIRSKIKEDLISLNIDNDKIFKNVFMREEIYHGNCFEAAPDIVALANTGFDLKGAINKDSVYGRGIFTGAHTQDNATFFINRRIEPGRINIIDIAPTVFRLMDIKHTALDGKALF